MVYSANPWTCNLKMLEIFDRLAQNLQRIESRLKMLKRAKLDFISAVERLSRIWIYNLLRKLFYGIFLIVRNVRRSNIWSSWEEWGGESRWLVEIESKVWRDCKTRLWIFHFSQKKNKLNKSRESWNIPDLNEISRMLWNVRKICYFKFLTNLSESRSLLTAAPLQRIHATTKNLSAFFC